MAQRNIICKMMVGEETLGVFLPSTNDLLGLSGYPDILDGEGDSIFFSLRYFLKYTKTVTNFYNMLHSETKQVIHTSKEWDYLVENTGLLLDSNTEYTDIEKMCVKILERHLMRY